MIDQMLIALCYRIDQTTIFGLKANPFNLLSLSPSIARRHSVVLVLHVSMESIQ